MLSKDNDSLLTWILLGVWAVSILTSASKDFFVDKAVRYWHARRAMPVDSDVDDDDASSVAPPAGYQQSDSSDGAARGAIMRDACAEVNDWHYYSNP